MSWRISFHIFGEYFSPPKMNFKFHDQNERGEIAISGKFKGEKYNYGNASYNVPKDTPRIQVFKYLADTFEPLLDELKSCGAESWFIEIGRFYNAQCNEELSASEILEIARLRCSLSYSAYRVSEGEEGF